MNKEEVSIAEFVINWTTYNEDYKNNYNLVAELNSIRKFKLSISLKAQFIKESTRFSEVTPDTWRVVSKYWDSIKTNFNP